MNHSETYKCDRRTGRQRRKGDLNMRNRAGDKIRKSMVGEDEVTDIKGTWT